MVAAKYCDVPPNPPAGGSVMVNSDGYMYGHNCSTDGYETIPGGGGCETQLNMESSEVVGDFRYVSNLLKYYFELTSYSECASSSAITIRI